MTELAPPQYDTDLPQALNDVLASSRAAECAKAVKAHAQRLDFRRQIEEEIWQLTLTVSTIENDFAEITAEVREIDNGRIIKRWDGSLRFFACQWRDLHEAYTFLMLDSKNSTGQINSKIGSFLNSIIPILKDPKFNLEQKKSSMQFYIESLKDFSARGDKIQMRFRTLSENVSGFKKELTRATTTNQSANQERTATLITRISALQEELEQASRFPKKSWSIITPTVNRGSTFIAGGGILGGSALRAYGGGVVAAEATGLAALAPAASMALLAAGVGALGYSIHSGYKDHSAQMNAKVDKLSALSVELRTLQSEDLEFQSTVAGIAKLDPVFARLVDRLTAMQRIWRLLTTDAQKLLYLLDEVEKTRDPRLVAVVAHDIAVRYETLKIVLDNYTLYVAAPRIW